mgnify:CR=1 FL=1
MSEITRKRCGHCRELQPCQKSINHFAHLAGALLSGGLWIPFWSFANDRADFVCLKCGSKIYQAERPISGASVVAAIIAAAVVLGAFALFARL